MCGSWGQLTRLVHPWSRETTSACCRSDLMDSFGPYSYSLRITGTPGSKCSFYAQNSGLINSPFLKLYSVQKTLSWKTLELKKTKGNFAVVDNISKDHVYFPVANEDMIYSWRYVLNSTQMLTRKKTLQLLSFSVRWVSAQTNSSSNSPDGCSGSRTESLDHRQLLNVTIEQNHCRAHSMSYLTPRPGPV